MKDIRATSAGAVTNAGLAFSVLILLTLTLMHTFYVGFQAGDDKSYLTGALGWLQSFPYVGENHWTLRHTITIPTALSIKLFGLNEFAVSLSNALYFTTFVVLNAWMAHR